MQHGYLSRSNEDTDKIKVFLPQLKTFTDSCRELELPIIWTQMVENTEESPENIATVMKLDGLVNPNLTHTKKSSFDFYAGLRPAESDTVITKYYYDAFADTKLFDNLKSKGIKTVILTGGYESRCVLGTAFGANGKGFHVVLAEDLVEEPSEFRTEVRTTVKVISSIIGYPLHSAEVLKLLNQ